MYVNTNSKTSTNSSFSSTFESITNVPTGRKDSNTYSISNNIYNYLDMNYTTESPVRPTHLTALDLHNIFTRRPTS